MDAIARKLIRFLAAAVLLPAAAWSLAALFLSERLGGAAPFAGALTGLAFAAVMLRCRGFWRKSAFCLLIVAAVLTWYFSQQPRMQADWQDDVARLPEVKQQGELVTIRNIRSFNYRSQSDYDIRYFDETFDLRRLKSVDLLLSHWGSPHVAHVMISFGFEGGRRLALSAETRKKRGQEYSGLRGFFRAYELIYIAGDERDLIRLRTNYRGEDVYLYRLALPPERARHMFLSYCRTMEKLSRSAAFYNALVDNCSTNALIHSRAYQVGELPYSWKLLASGHLDEVVYQMGGIKSALPFAELERRSLITQAARAADQAEDFSERIRAGLPSL
jgi:hypothetical protein